MSDQLPETDKDFTHEAAVSGKSTDVDATRTDTSTSVHAANRASAEHQLVAVISSSFCSLPFKKKITKMLFSFALLCSYIVKKTSSMS